jgi:hypothetical protein
MNIQDPRLNPLFNQGVEDHFKRFEQIYDDHFARQYGFKKDPQAPGFMGS